MSVEYYTRLERGSISSATPEILDSLSKALRLNDDERAHLFDLAHAGQAQQADPPAIAAQKSGSPIRLFNGSLMQ